MNFNFLLNNKLSVDMAIDAGTDMTLIYLRDNGIVLKEPSYIAYDINTGKIQAVGYEAYEMYQKAPPCIKVIKPLSEGVISDYDMACKMLRSFIASVCKKTFLKPRIISSVPSGSTEIEKKAICDALKEAGAREVYLMEEPLCAAAGAGCDISLARGLLIADIGGGRTDTASISFARPVISKSVTVAGNTFCEEIIKYVRKNHNLNIGEVTAENIKKELGCAYPFDLSKSMEVSGCDITTGFPCTITLSSEEIRETLTPFLKKIADLIKTTLEETPPELQSDILEDGILVTGGGAMLFGIEKYLRMETGLKVFVTENMDECVIKGVGAQLEMLDAPANTSDRFFYSIYNF